MVGEPKEPADWPGERKGAAKVCEEVEQLEAAEQSTLRLQTPQFLLVIKATSTPQPQQTPAISPDIALWTYIAASARITASTDTTFESARARIKLSL
jgi:hypothetical protein